MLSEVCFEIRVTLCFRKTSQKGEVSIASFSFTLQNGAKTFSNYAEVSFFRGGKVSLLSKSFPSAELLQKTRFEDYSATISVFINCRVMLQFLLPLISLKL